MNKKNFVSILVIAIVLIVIIILIFFVFKNLSSNNNLNQIKNDQNTNAQYNKPLSKESIPGWQVYRSELYGYELQFPDDWYRADPFDGPYLNPVNGEVNTHIESFSPESNKLVNDSAYPGPTFQIASYAVKTDFTLREIAMRDEDIATEDRAFIEETEKSTRDEIITGRPAIRYIIDGHKDPNVTEPAYIAEMLIKDGNKIHDIEFIVDSFEEFEKYEDDYELMLSTFQFIY